MSSCTPILQHLTEHAPLEFDELADRGGTLVVTLTDTQDRRIVLSFDGY